MADTLTAPAPRRELAHRASVAAFPSPFYWDVEEDSTSIETFDDATEQTLHFAVPRARALDAFYHPLAHARTTGTPFSSRASTGRAFPRRRQPASPPPPSTTGRWPVKPAPSDAKNGTASATSLGVPSRPAGTEEM